MSNATGEFEREKFNKEIELRAKEIELDTDRYKLDKNRMILVGLVVPITLALVATLPSAVINYLNQKSEIEKIRAEDRKTQTEIVSQIFIKYTGEERKQAICHLTSPENLIGHSLRIALRNEFKCQ